MSEHADSSPGVRAGEKENPIEILSSSTPIFGVTPPIQDLVSLPSLHEFQAFEPAGENNREDLSDVVEGELSRGMAALSTSPVPASSPPVFDEDPLTLDVAEDNDQHAASGSEPNVTDYGRVLLRLADEFPSDFEVQSAPISPEIPETSEGYGSPDDRGKRKSVRAFSPSKRPAPGGIDSPREVFIDSQPSSDPSRTVAKAEQLLVTEIHKSDVLRLAQEYRGDTLPLVVPKNTTIRQYACICQLTDADLLFPGQTAAVKYGHCKYWVVREEKQPGSFTETPKLVEGGTNNDAPRVQPRGMTKKVYIYHLLAYDAALRGDKHLTEAKLNAVSRSKKEDQALTIVHLCGHKWCLNTDHYRVRAKKYNDEQEYCHFGLQKAADPQKLDMIRYWYCGHRPIACWTINYREPFATIKAEWASNT